MKKTPKPKPPHRVDERYGFLDSIRYVIALDSNYHYSYGRDFDKMTVGKVTDGKRYLGNGCHQKINTH
jgi:hypothetical protein